MKKILNWLLKLSKNKSWISPSDVPEELKNEIFNVIWDKYLTNLLFVMKRYWFIDFSKNPINDFEEEREIKILEIDPESVENKLLELWAKKTFEWEIEDIYYDYADFRFDLWWEKKAFRLRRKLDLSWNESFYYTIKRKRSKETLRNGLRVCYEKEFEILNLWAFKDMIIDVLELIKSRRKVKIRKAYYLWWIKFDMDFYKWIPPLLEIEAEHSSIANDYITKLWLEKNKTSLSWSRNLFKFYDVKYEIFNSKEQQDNLKNL